MITIASVTALFGGMGLVASAPRHPAREAALEWSGGLLVIAGCLLLGLGLGLSTS